jgi:tRNA (uracil-5-)-methyltransferase TRM9
MKTSTVHQLNELNRQFYTQMAASWTASRQYAWPSWQTFQQHSQLDRDTTVSIADIGCGHGRLAHFLSEHFQQLHYHGLDLSAELLAEAQQDLPTNVEITTTVTDVVVDLLTPKDFLHQDYDLITLFGVLHHIPSRQLRIRVLEYAIAHLTPGGEIWLTLWTPEILGFKPPRKQAIPEGIDPSDLEVGDSFLAWKDSSATRFVHWMQLNEIDELRALVGNQIKFQWPETQQGERGNLCWLIQKTRQ